MACSTRSKVSESIVNCTFGSISECHKLSYSRTCGFMNFADLSEDEKELLILRSGLDIQHEKESSTTICFHHKKVFLDRYESQQTSCFDPLQKKSA